MTKIMTVLAVTLAHITTFATEQVPEQMIDEKAHIQPIQIHTIPDSNENHIAIDMNDLEHQAIDYNGYTSNGITVTPTILDNMGGHAMLETLLNTHRKVYLTQPIDQQALLLSRAIMEYMEGGNASYFMQKTLPFFWNAVNKASLFGKYTLSITSPIITAASLLINSLTDTEANSSQFQTENNTNLQHILSGLNIASLVSFQLGKYVFSNMYDYSSQLKNYYLHATFEKEYIRSTFKYSSDEDKNYDMLPAKQKPYSKDDAVPQQYFEKLGPIATELAREIIADENTDQNAMLDFQQSIKSESCLKNFYRKGNIFSIMGGIFRIAAGTCAVANTVISTTSLPMQDDMLSNIFGITQFCLTSFSLSLTELARYFEKKSSTMSKKFVIAPVLNPDLLNTITTPRQEADE